MIINIKCQSCWIWDPQGCFQNNLYTMGIHSVRKCLWAATVCQALFISTISSQGDRRVSKWKKAATICLTTHLPSFSALSLPVMLACTILIFLSLEHPFSNHLIKEATLYSTLSRISYISFLCGHSGHVPSS